MLASERSIVGRAEQVGIEGDAGCGEHRFEFGERRLDIVGDRLGLCAQLADHHHHDAGLAHHRGLAERDARRDGDLGDIADADRAGGRGGDDHRREVFRGARLAVGAQGELLVGGLDHPGAEQAGRGGRRLGDVGEREAVAAQPVRGDADLQLPFVAAEQIEIGDPLDAE